MNDDEIELICPECGTVFSVPDHTTAASSGEYRPCTWTCRRSADTDTNHI